MNKMNPKVDAIINKSKKWQEEFRALRKIILGCKLTEALKWGQPCYLFQEKNIVLVHGFKDYCALLFFKGALLKDAKGVLIQQTENVQAARQIRFTNVREIVKMKKTLEAYILEAVEVEKAGLKVKLKKTAEFSIPEEFQSKLDEIPPLKTAFAALTREGKEHTSFISPLPNNPKLGRQELKTIFRIFSMAGGWMNNNPLLQSLSGLFMLNRCTDL